MLKRVIRKLRQSIKRQEGQVLAIVLVMILVMSLMIPAFLVLAASGLKQGLIVEDSTKRLYSADAGVDYGIRLIQTKATGLPQLPSDPPLLYTADANGINGSSDVGSITGKIYFINNTTYEIQSIAKLDEATGTTIISRVSIVDFYDNLLQNAITSPGKVECKPGTSVLGNVQVPPFGNETGNAVQPPYTIIEVPPIWPPWVGLEDFYLDQIDPGDPHFFTDTTITVGTDTPIGPLYVDGNLTIDGPGTGYLNGTIYVTGGLSFANENITLTLGNLATSNTIYVKGEGYPAQGPAWSVYFPPGKITLNGPGAIISEQGIDFQPMATSSDFMLILSTKGEVFFHPNSDFTGSIGGQTNASLWSGGTMTWVNPPNNLNVPGKDMTKNIVSSTSNWKIGSFDPTIIIVSTALPDGNVGVGYSASLEAIGGSGSYNWSIPPGSLPDGLSLNSITGAITGTPTAQIMSGFIVTVMDTENNTATQALSVKVVDRITIVTTSLPAGLVGVTYNQTVTTTGGSLPYTWAITTGSLPTGLSLNNSSGAITGTATASGTFSFRVTVVDSIGGIAVKNLSISIAVPPAVATNAATGVTMTSATLNGNLTALGASGSVTALSFDWGTSSTLTAYTNTTGTPSSSGTVPRTFTVGLTGLTRNTNYYFRAKAVGSDGSTVYGVIVNFKTPNS